MATAGADGAPDPAVWIDARQAYYVIEGGYIGGMGAEDAMPFSDQARAQDFARRHGGRVAAFSEVPERYVFAQWRGGAAPSHQPIASTDPRIQSHIEPHIETRIMKLPSRRRFIGIAATSSALGLLPWRALAFSARPQAGLEPVVWRGVALGADAELHLLHPDRDAARRLIDSAVDELRRLETVFSLYRDDSALAVLNRQGHLNDPPADLLRLLSESRRFSVLTGGVFDPTVQPLWQLYAGHFSQPGADPDGPPPAPARGAGQGVPRRRGARQPRHPLRAARHGRHAERHRAGGYITDRVTDLLRRGGLDRALVDMGRSMPWASGATGSHGAPAWPTPTIPTRWPDG